MDACTCVSYLIESLSILYSSYIIFIYGTLATAYISSFNVVLVAGTSLATA